jgi:SSS family solute:Na+ symporter
MVSGLFVPLAAAMLWPGCRPASAIGAMILGGTTTVVLTASEIALPFGLDANIYGITASVIAFIFIESLPGGRTSSSSPSS